MASSTIALIILVVFVVMLMSGKFPFSVSCAIMALCMVWFLPELKLSDIYSGFARNIILLIAGMCIIGDALFRTGVANDIGQMICRSGFAKTEKIFICTIAVVVTLQSAFPGGCCGLHRRRLHHGRIFRAGHGQQHPDGSPRL